MTKEHRRSKDWTEEEIEIVRGAVARGESASMIARRLPGRNRNMVLGTMHRNGWTKKGRAEIRATFNRSAPVVRALAAYQRDTQGPGSITLAGPAWSWPDSVRVAA